MPKVHIPTPLRQYAGKQPAVDVKGSTVGEALSGLVTDHPDLRRHLYTEDGTRCVVDSPQVLAGVQFMHDLIYRYRVMPGPVEEAAMATQGGWGSGTITLFGGAKAAMALGGRW